MARQPRFTRKTIIAYIRYHKLDPRLVGLTVFRTNGRTYSAGTIRTYLYLGREIGDAFRKSMEDWYEREILELPHAPPELPKRFPMAPDGLLADPEETPIHVLIERRNRARERSCLSEAQIYDDMKVSLSIVVRSIFLSDFSIT
ncbi:MAG: hypothetical protein ACYDBI_05860 [Thermoplasmataceae archaeon]